MDRLGMSNVGSQLQLKISNILSTSIFLLLVYKYLKSDTEGMKSRLLKLIGDNKNSSI